MASYITLLDAALPTIQHSSRTSLLMRPFSLSRNIIPTPVTRITKLSQLPSTTRKMSLLFPGIGYHHPARYGPAVETSGEIAPIFSLFDNALNDLNQASRHLQRQVNSSWNPKFDVKEEKDFYTIEAEVPGVEQSDLNIEFTDEHTIQIKGRHQRHSESGTRPSRASAIEAKKQTSAIEEGTATPTSEASAMEGTASPRSYKATVSDEAPANDSAVSEAEKTPAQELSTTTPAQPEPAKKPEAPKAQYWISERSSGSFTRSFAFPGPISQDHVKASLKNGVLTINIPKAPKAESRRRVQIE